MIVRFVSRSCLSTTPKVLRCQVRVRPNRPVPRLPIPRVMSRCVSSRSVCVPQCVSSKCRVRPHPSCVPQVQCVALSGLRCVPSCVRCVKTSSSPVRCVLPVSVWLRSLPPQPPTGVHRVSGVPRMVLRPPSPPYPSRCDPRGRPHGQKRFGVLPSGLPGSQSVTEGSTVMMQSSSRACSWVPLGAVVGTVLGSVGEKPKADAVSTRGR